MKICSELVWHCVHILPALRGSRQTVPLVLRDVKDDPCHPISKGAVDSGLCRKLFFAGQFESLFLSRLFELIAYPSQRIISERNKQLSISLL